MKLSFKTTTDLKTIERLAKAGGADMHDLDKLDISWVAMVDKEEAGISGIRKFKEYYVVDMLAVKEKFRDKDIESKLLDVVVTFAKKNKIDTLYTMFKQEHKKFATVLGFKSISLDQLPKDYDGACLTCDQRGLSCFPEPMMLKVI